MRARPVGFALLAAFACSPKNVEPPPESEKIPSYIVSADDCAGVPGVTIAITDSAGRVTTLTSSESGSFLAYAGPSSPVPPLSIRLVTATGERAMQGLASGGDCNRCHAIGGQGRIVVP